MYSTLPVGSSLFGGSEPAETHRIHHVVAVNLHRGVLRELETRLFPLRLLCGLLLCALGQFLVPDVREALVKVVRFRLGRLLCLRAQEGDFGTDLLERGPLQSRGLSNRT